MLRYYTKGYLNESNQVMGVSVCAKSLQLCLTLCNPTDYSLPGSSVHGILQATILEWVPCLPPGDRLDPGIEPTSLTSPVLAR